MNDSPSEDKVILKCSKNLSFPPPITSWEDETLNQDIFEKYYNKNKKKLSNKPTTIQQYLFSCMLTGKDILGVAPTGSGKTLAFALPLAAQIKKFENQTQNSGLILAPTRELVIQISKVMKRFPSLFDITIRTIYGGREEEEDGNSILSKTIIVATPGRLLDMIQTKKIVLNNTIKCLILDEADRMLQLGMNEQIEAIIKSLPKIHQTVLTSATWTSSAKKTIVNWLDSDFYQIFVNSIEGSDKMMIKHNNNNKEVEEDVEGEEEDSEGGSLTLGKKIIQIVHVCAEHKKPRKLIRHIEKVREEEKNVRNAGPMIIFCNKIKTVQFVTDFLTRQNVKVIAIHGGMIQIKRENALRDFRAGKYSCLVATDVAGRGIHIENLVHVVNYDFPKSLTQYAHRVGRCGRKNTTGTAFSFFTRNLACMAPDLVKLLKTCDQLIDPNLNQLAIEYISAEETLNSIDDKVDNDDDNEIEPIEGKNDNELAKNAQEESFHHEEEDIGQEEEEEEMSDDREAGEGHNEDEEQEELSDHYQEDDDDENPIFDEVDYVGAVPLKPFRPQLQEKKSITSKKRPTKRGSRGGKKHSKKKVRSM